MPRVSEATHRPRRSASAEAALCAEIKRVSQMTVEERIIAALTMRERFGWIQMREKSHLSKAK